MFDKLQKKTRSSWLSDVSEENMFCKKASIKNMLTRINQPPSNVSNRSLCNNIIILENKYREYVYLSK
jgi:hypothetical protein